VLAKEGIAGLLAALCIALLFAAGSSAAPWQVAARLGLGTSSTSVSCAGSTDCWSVEGGELLHSSDGGSAWAQEASLVPKDVVAIDTVACPARAACYATATVTGGRFAMLVLGPQTVLQRSLPSLRQAPQVSCLSAMRCVASDGQTVLRTSNGWASYESAALPTVVYDNPSLACVLLSGRCWIVGDNGETPVIEASIDGARDWVAQSAPDTIDGIYGLSCATSETCMAVGSDSEGYAAVIATSDGGRAWTPTGAPASAALSSVACASATSCFTGLAGGNTPFLYATGNGGEAWTEQTLPIATVASAPYLSCPTTSACVAVASGFGFETADAGGTWSGSALPAAPGSPSAIACPGSGHCVAVGVDSGGKPMVLVSSDGGSSWGRGTVPTGTGALADVACPTLSICYATATAQPPLTKADRAQALSSSDGGMTWRLDTVAEPGGALGALSCPSAGTCLAVGFSLRSNSKLALTTNGGASWEPVAVPSGVDSTETISCSAEDACVLFGQEVDGTTKAYTTSNLGASFTAHAMPPSDYVSGADCVGQRCVAVGAYEVTGAIFSSSDAGATWVTQSLPDAGSSLPEAVSCSGEEDCAISSLDFAQTGGPQIDATTDGGSSWQAFAVPARNEVPLGLACTETSCLASDYTAAGDPIILSGGF
jgi:photosystem II stability/assembly factor-like uncharacterized protein